MLELVVQVPTFSACPHTPPTPVSSAPQAVRAFRVMQRLPRPSTRAAVALARAQQRRTFFPAAYELAKKVTPKISATEAAALDAGTVGFDRDIFAGTPSLKQLKDKYDLKVGARPGLTQAGGVMRGRRPVLQLTVVGCCRGPPGRLVLCCLGHNPQPPIIHIHPCPAAGRRSRRRSARSWRTRWRSCAPCRTTIRCTRTRTFPSRYAPQFKYLRECGCPWCIARHPHLLSWCALGRSLVCPPPVGLP
jgi:hypothetical protein